MGFWRLGGFDCFSLPLACLGLATYTAASKIKTFNSSMLDLYLRNLPLTLLCPAGLANLMQTRGLSWQSLASRMASIKAGKMLQSLTALTQIHCAGDSTANINLTKSRILTSSDYYPLQNLQSCDSVYTLQMLAFLLKFERFELLQLKFLKNKQESFCRTGSYFLTTILILASSLEPYVSIPRSLPRMSHRMSHQMSKYLFPLPNDDVVVILFATYLSPIWCIYRGSRALFNRQSSHTWLSV